MLIFDPNRRGGSSPIGNGAQGFGVEEPLEAGFAGAFSGSFRFETILPVEFDVIAEPKLLSPQNLCELVGLHGSARAAARAIGASEAFVRQNIQNQFSNP